ncbi:MAG: RNA 2',3'-cyclic phosphodiesterase [Planctomycetaceae bacterium]|nr:RNA 2',3'-cyclic phosphodiesterase [Planctomycetota bacterium]NUN52015.1 RNA 2',3'-cyclic phosphodiesterase [Planctomycetaceae bacterium]
MPRTGAFRAFFAIPLAPSTAGALERAAAVFVAGAAGPGSPPWRLTPASRLHVTLRFLGDCGEDLRRGLRAALDGAVAGVPPFALSFPLPGGWHLFPGPRAPRVLAAPVSEPSGSLHRLAASLEESVRALGFAAEDRPWLAHVTVARAPRGRGGRGRNPGRDVHPPASRLLPGAASPGRVATGGEATGRGATGRGAPRVDAPIPGMVADRVVLYRSVLGPGGPEYEELESAALAGTAPEPGTTPEARTTRRIGEEGRR